MNWFQKCSLVMLGFVHAQSFASAHYLQLTAVVSDPNQNAAFECWEISTAFVNYPTVGTVAKDFADVSNISYVILPPGSKEGLHKPPHPMFFILLSGSAHITLPTGNDELWIKDGENRLIIAVDTQGDGHYTEYPSNQPSIALQIPFKDGVAPAHRVIKDGPCDKATSVMSGEFTSQGHFEELK